jgi:methionyl-tRNA formyltransferase
VPPRMRIVFCGTPSFAVPSFKHLLAQSDFEIVAAITQPDRPRGRGQEIFFSRVKEAAVAEGVPVHQPEKIRAPEAQQILERLAPDAIVIIAYGQIIPARLLPIPKLGWINLHASLLPKYRGAAPINWAIVNGETQTGVTTMRIDAGMDTGDMLLRREVSILGNETAPELVARLSEIGAPLMAETLRGLAAGTLAAQPQDHSQASLAPMLKKEDGRIDWQLSAHQIYNRMRGFAPWPGAYTDFRGQTCKLWGEPVTPPNNLPASKDNSPPGTLLTAADELYVCCGSQSLLRVLFVQLEGRKRISAAEFRSGFRLTTHESFTSL